MLALLIDCLEAQLANALEQFGHCVMVDNHRVFDFIHFGFIGEIVHLIESDDCQRLDVVQHILHFNLKQIKSKINCSYFDF